MPVIVLEELSGVKERPMISPMPTMARPQQRYDQLRQEVLKLRRGVQSVIEAARDPLPSDGSSSFLFRTISGTPSRPHVT